MQHAFLTRNAHPLSLSLIPLTYLHNLLTFIIDSGSLTNDVHPLFLSLISIIIDTIGMGGGAGGSSSGSKGGKKGPFRGFEDSEDA